MSLLALLPHGGSVFPGFSRLKQKRLVIYYPTNSEVIQHDIQDTHFAEGYELQVNSGYKVGIAISRITSAYDEGQTMEIVTNEDWSYPMIGVGARVEFWAEVSEVHVASKEPAWVQNAQGTGQKLLFSGKIESVRQFAAAGEGSGVSYLCRSWIHFGSFIDVVNEFGNGYRLPERLYNVDSTDDPVEYKRSIKGSTSAPTSPLYNYAPWGLSGILGATGTHASGAATNTTNNKKMTVKEIIIDLFASHGKQLKREGIVPSTWGHINGTGTKPYVEAELNALTFVPDKIILSGIKFLDAIKSVLRKSYPNYGIWVDRSRVWHFTPILDNLSPSATNASQILNPGFWVDTRLGIVGIRLAEPEAGDTGRVFGRLARGDAGSDTSDRYTAVRIVGHEIVTTEEVSVADGTLLPAWGNGSAPVQTNLESGYQHQGPAASVNRHWDRGDTGNGIPLYKTVAGSGTKIRLYFKGHFSELWPHTTDEWNGTSCLYCPTYGLAVAGSGIFTWYQHAQRFTILDCENVTDIGDGEPGYWVEIDPEGALTTSSIQTYLSGGNWAGARIQLADDLALPTTVNPNLASMTYRMFSISSTTITREDQTITDNPAEVCQARAYLPTGPLRPDAMGQTPGVAGPTNLLEFGQSLGGTSISALGRIHSQAGPGGEFWFAGKLIIPLAAIRRGKTKQNRTTPDVCKRGGAILNEGLKVVITRTTESFREVRVPPLSSSGEETFGGTAAIVAGVRRELIIKSDDFIDASQATEYEKLATALFRTTADIEPSGEGFTFIAPEKYLSLIDLHFRLDLDFYRTFAVGGLAPWGLKNAIVTRIDYDFSSGEAIMSMTKSHNPLGSFEYDSLRDALVSAKRVREIDAARRREQRARQCANSYQKITPIAEYQGHLCTDLLERSSGPNRGKAPPPVNCHASDDLIETPDGIEVTATGGSGGYPSGGYPTTFDLSSGLGWQVLPFRDTLGRLYLYDRSGGILRGDESAIVEGEELHPNAIGTEALAGWDEPPLRRGHEMATLALNMFSYLTGLDPATPAQTIYNIVEDYDDATGIITLHYNNLVVSAYANGLAAISDGPDPLPHLYIDDNDEGTITLKEPSKGFPSAAIIKPGAHIYIVAQRKPLPGSGFARGTRMFKDSAGDWFGVEPDGTIEKATVTGSTNFVPAATTTTGSPVFTPIPKIVGLLVSDPNSHFQNASNTADSHLEELGFVLAEETRRVKMWAGMLTGISGQQGTPTYNGSIKQYVRRCNASADSTIIVKSVYPSKHYKKNGSNVFTVVIHYAIVTPPATDKLWYLQVGHTSHLATTEDVPSLNWTYFQIPAAASYSEKRIYKSTVNVTTPDLDITDDYFLFWFRRLGTSGSDTLTTSAVDIVDIEVTAGVKDT